MATKTTRVFQMLLQLEVHSLNSNGDASSTSGVLSMTELRKMYGFLYSGSKPPSWTKPDGRSRSDSPPTLFCQRLRVRFIEWVAALGHGVAWSVADDVQLEQPTDGALVNELSDYTTGYAVGESALPSVVAEIREEVIGRRYVIRVCPFTTHDHSFSHCTPLSLSPSTVSGERKSSYSSSSSTVSRNPRLWRS